MFLKRMNSDGVINIYLVGASWCEYSRKADLDLMSADRSDPSLMVQQYPVNDVVNRLYCDLDTTDPSIPKENLCKLVNGTGYPIIAACQGNTCERLVGGYYPDFASYTTLAINSSLG